MKKMMIPFFALAISAAACSKDGDENCYWTDNGGNDYDHYPTTAEIEQIKQSCGCEPTFTKHCD